MTETSDLEILPGILVQKDLGYRINTSDGGITEIPLTNAGSGYTSAPEISVISNAGTGTVIICVEHQ